MLKTQRGFEQNSCGRCDAAYVPRHCRNMARMQAAMPQYVEYTRQCRNIVRIHATRSGAKQFYRASQLHKWPNTNKIADTNGQTQKVANTNAQTQFHKHGRSKARHQQCDKNEIVNSAILSDATYFHDGMTLHKTSAHLPPTPNSCGNAANTFNKFPTHSPGIEGMEGIE